MLDKQADFSILPLAAAVTEQQLVEQYRRSYCQGIKAWAAGDYLQAQSALQKWVQVCTDPVIRQPVAKQLLQSWLILAQLAQLRDDKKQEQAFYAAVLQLDCRNLRALSGIYALLKALEPIQQIEVLAQFYQKTADIVFLLDFLDKYTDSQAVFYYRQLVQEQKEKKYTSELTADYLVNKNYLATLAQLQNNLENDYLLLLFAQREKRLSVAVEQLPLPYQKSGLLDQFWTQRKEMADIQQKWQKEGLQWLRK